jgi:hypothetical protein
VSEVLAKIETALEEIRPSDHDLLTAGYPAIYSVGGYRTALDDVAELVRSFRAPQSEGGKCPCDCGGTPTRCLQAEDDAAWGGTP